MNATVISILLSQLDVDGIIDVRATPDPNRRGQFLAGWHDHSERNQTYTNRTLEQLTWHNLGWRLACRHPKPAGLDNDEICDIFDTTETLWYQRRE